MMYSNVNWKKLWSKIDDFLHAEKGIRDMELINIYSVRVNNNYQVVLKVKDKGSDKDIHERMKDLRQLLNEDNDCNNIFGECTASYKIELEDNADDKILAVSEFYDVEYYDCRNSSTFPPNRTD